MGCHRLEQEQVRLFWEIEHLALYHVWGISALTWPSFLKRYPKPLVLVEDLLFYLSRIKV